MADKAPITPKVLQWARESARMPLEIAAAKVPVTPQKLAEWEQGETMPSISQAEKLAKIYRRPFAIFFLPDIPHDFQPLQDFRRKSAQPLGTASIFIIREIQQKQDWIRDMLEDNNEPRLPFVGKFSVRDNPVMVANDILDILQIAPGNYSAKPISEWISKAEAKGIFVSRASFLHSHLKLDSDEFQGFTIADPYAPYVFVNSDDWDAPQLFSLVHELAHVWIAESGVSDEVEPGLKHTGTLHPVELFCNEVAANALMPAMEMKDLSSEIFDAPLEMYKIIKRLGVSSFAFLYRAYNLQIIPQEKYQKLKTNAETEFKAFLQKEEDKKLKQKAQESGPNPYLLRLNKNGRLFTAMVLDAYHSGVVAATIAAALLNTKVNNFSKFEPFLNT